MKFTVWNMCNKADQSVAADQIKDFFEDGYDAVALQEVPYSDDSGLPVSAVLSSEMGLDHIFVHTRGLPSRKRNRIAGYGTAVISTSGLYSATHAILRTDRWSYMTNGKGNQRVAVAFSHPASPESRIIVGHLSYSLIGGIGSAGMRDERIKLANFLDEQTVEGKILFAGDMNCEPHTELDHILAKKGLAPVTPSGLSIEHPTYQSRYPGLKRIQAPLDRVYADPSIHPIVKLGSYGPSDHRPLLIEI